ncbi:Cysteine-rich secretory protein, allergen V5/Tpx-1-related [Parasponia andersonii]|uniref:Cysteine-rich secretory protein, allergen V5/Tpx-1-related n=1 Tax=Parasponia andersonii TaxID=3476 RepID=A0A2P5DQW1_PARAD|nr:Cysteine-rich secretory protein, allergen V5/Tpx-1-related [Parasponia andersonii]
MSFRSISLALIICTLGRAVLKSCYAQDSPRDFLEAHNWARAEVGVGPMEWDDSVAAYAQDYANQRSGDCNLIHSEGSYGENLAWSGGDFSAADAVGMWVGEKSLYDYNSNSCLGENPWDCLHYTQVVWRDSTRLGCAKVWCDVGGTFIICNYDPPGNVIGKRPFGNLAKSI